MPQKNTGQDLVEITVTVDNHEHAGEQVKKGDKIKVTPSVAEMLQTQWDAQQKNNKEA